MQVGDFDFYHEFLEERCGLTLSEDQTYLLQSRLEPISKQWGFNCIEDMTFSLRALPDVTLIAAIISAMGNTDTAFFRDYKSFAYIEKHILPELGQNKNIPKPLQIWSAGCASGQEAYSLAMICQRNKKHTRAHWWGAPHTIWATDISKAALQQARKGHYTQNDVQNGLPASYIMVFCKQEKQDWVVKEKVKKHIVFEEHNLVDNIKPRSIFSLILCRYVLGNMSQRVQTLILEKFAENISQDGYLILGTGETIQNDILDQHFSAIPDQAGVYKRS